MHGAVPTDVSKGRAHVDARIYHTPALFLAAVEKQVKELEPTADTSESVQTLLLDLSAVYAVPGSVDSRF